LIRPWNLTFSTMYSRIIRSGNNNQGADPEKLDSIASCWDQEDSHLCTRDKLALDETSDKLRYSFTLGYLLFSESSQNRISSSFVTLL
jgi:hypothetical protein